MRKPQTAETSTAPARCLPYPFEDIRFYWDVSDCGVYVMYAGTAERLLACGAIEPGMTDKRPKPSPKPRLDSAGHSYQRQAGLASDGSTPRFTIKRWIADPKFAQKLPGVPRLLSFKRLDWLDSHPGTIHVDTYSNPGRRGIGERERRHTISAGTRDALIAVTGFPRSMFPSNQPFKSRWLASGDHGVPQGFLAGTYEWATVSVLMRGYYEIHHEVSVMLAGIASTDCLPRGAVSSELAPPSRPSHLRLVVDNTVRP